MYKIDKRIIFHPTGFCYQNTKARAVKVRITPNNSQSDELLGIRVKTMPLG